MTFPSIFIARISWMKFSGLLPKMATERSDLLITWVKEGQVIAMFLAARRKFVSILRCWLTLFKFSE